MGLRIFLVEMVGSGNKKVEWVVVRYHIVIY